MALYIRDDLKGVSKAGGIGLYTLFGYRTLIESTKTFFHVYNWIQHWDFFNLFSILARAANIQMLIWLI